MLSRAIDGYGGDEGAEFAAEGLNSTMATSRTVLHEGVIGGDVGRGGGGGLGGHEQQPEFAVDGNHGRREGEACGDGLAAGGVRAGAAMGVAVTAVEGGPSPSMLVATTITLYAVPLVRRVMVQVSTNWKPALQVKVVPDSVVVAV